MIGAILLVKLSKWFIDGFELDLLDSAMMMFPTSPGIYNNNKRQRKQIESNIEKKI